MLSSEMMALEICGLKESKMGATRHPSKVVAVAQSL
jgi:hypothetical protein